jgi:1,4-dihydroxy-2-naphthoate octaprenyltransferase
MNRGWGEALIFFAFGPLVTLGTFYVMSGSVDAWSFLIGIPHGFFITAVIWINEFPDYHADRQAGKRNLVVRLGPRVSRYPYLLMMALPFAVVLGMVFSRPREFVFLGSLLAFPLAFKAMRTLWKEYGSHERIVPAQALTIKALIVHGLLFSLGLILTRLTHG